MKRCDYCGHENSDEAVNCVDCETEFPDDPTQDFLTVKDRLPLQPGEPPENQGEPPRGAGDIFLGQMIRRKQRFGRKLILRWVIVSLLPFIGAEAIVLWLHDDVTFGFGLLLFFLFLPISLPYIFYGVRLVRATSYLVRDPLPKLLGGHVLLLRPFVADSLPADRNTFLEALVTHSRIYGLRWLLPEKNLQRLIGLEVRQRIGPLLAISNPKEALPSEGAAEIIARDDEWQHAVTQIAQTAKCIILEIGGTRGFLWELRYIRDNVDLHKVFAVIDLEDLMEKHWSDLQQAFHEGGFVLPRTYPGSGSVIRFEPDGHGIIATTDAQNAWDLVSTIEACLSGHWSQSPKIEESGLSQASPEQYQVSADTIASASVSAQQDFSTIEKAQMIRWRKRLLRGVFSGGLAGCLLVCLSFFGLAVGIYLTHRLIMVADVQVTSGSRGLALVLGLPSVGLALATFCLFSPLFFRFHRALTRTRPADEQLDAPNRDQTKMEKETQ